MTRKRAKFNWHLAYSLHNNPQLRAKRKHFLDQLKTRMEETYARIENEKKALKESMKITKVNGEYTVSCCQLILVVRKPVFHFLVNRLYNNRTAYQENMSV